MTQAYDTIRHYYYIKAWDIDKVALAVQRGRITEDEYARITGETYTAPAETPTLESRVTALETRVDGDMADQAAALALLGVDTEVS